MYIKFISKCTGKINEKTSNFKNILAISKEVYTMSLFFPLLSFSLIASVFRFLLFLLDSASNRSLLLQQSGWQTWLIKHFTDTSSSPTTSSEESATGGDNVLNDLLINIFSELIIHTMTWDKNAHTVIDQTIYSFHYLNYSVCIYYNCVIFCSCLYKIGCCHY